MDSFNVKFRGQHRGRWIFANGHAAQIVIEEGRQEDTYRRHRVAWAT